MPAQSSISSLLSLRSSPPPAPTSRARSSDSFQRLLDSPAQSNQGRPENVGHDQSRAQVRESHAGRGSEPTQRQSDSEVSRPKSADSRADKPRETPSAIADEQGTPNASRNADKASSPSAVPPEQAVGEELPLEQAQALLARLSDQDWAQLSDDVKAVLTELKAQVDAGALDPAVEEALQQLLSDLENGAPLEVIAQQLDAIPVDALPSLAARFPEAQTLRDALGKRGAAYLSQLSAVASPESTGGSASGPSATLVNLGSASDSSGLDLSALLEAGKISARSGREEFGLLLQNLAKGEGAKPVDLGSSATAAGALAQTEGSARSQPVAAADRQFTVQSEVRVPVGQGQWGQAVGQRVLWMASQKISSAELRLDPPDLGPVQVRVSSHQDQISVTFTSPQPAVREALDQNAARLREMFTEQGLDLVDVNVSDQSGRESMAGDGEGQRGGGHHASGAEEGESQPVERVVSDRLVDHYA